MQLIIGVLFVSISATVTPASLKHLVLPTLGLVAVLVLVTRPLVAFLATVRTDLTRGERQFTGWMAPRGIVAAATASTFGTGLAAHHVGGAAKILPVTFLVIVATVTIYGLTAVPVARRLHVTRPARTRPLLVGGDPWVIDLARALRSADLDVLMWAGSDDERELIKQAGLDLMPGELLAAATATGAALEGITAVLLLTAEDDFNALAATVMASNAETHVYRLAPRHPTHGVVAPYTGGDTVFAPTLTRETVSARHTAGAQIITQPRRRPDRARNRHPVPDRPRRPTAARNHLSPPRPPAGRHAGAPGPPRAGAEPARRAGVSGPRGGSRAPRGSPAG